MTGSTPAPGDATAARGPRWQHVNDKWSSVFLDGAPDRKASLVVANGTISIVGMVAGMSPALSATLRHLLAEAETIAGWQA